MAIGVVEVGWSRGRRVFILFLTMAALPAIGCGGKAASTSGAGARGATGGAGGAGDGTLVAWSDLAQSAISLQGGEAPSAGGEAQAAGSAHVVSNGGISIDPSLPPPPAPNASATPDGAVAVTTKDLTTDYSGPGSISISGNVATGGTDPTRKVTAGGDIFLDGTLTAADLGGTRQSLELDAPNGTVTITGALDASGTKSKGQGGGAVTINAKAVVVTGKLLTTGADGTTAGNGGAITITAASGVTSSGTIDSSGGNAVGAGAMSGAQGGDLTIKATGDVALGGMIRVRGGAAASKAADANGGASGNVILDCSGALTDGASIDARGGFATAVAGGGKVIGGAGGSFKVGEAAAPSAVSVLVSMLVTGGDGAAAGGAGGNVLLEAHGGDLRIAAELDASGGGGASPGSAGNITGNPGPENPNASIDIAGHIAASGGSAPNGSSGNGAAGGIIRLVQQAPAGNMLLEPGSEIDTDGGKSAGSGTAGPGGLAYLFTIHGNASLHGTLTARGGDAPDPGGHGGDGGMVYVFTALAHDRMSGTLIIETDGLIDASGGAGTTGGSARNNGAKGVALFPVVQNNEYSVEQIAVLINSDGVHGPDRGWIDNQGHIIAQGGKANGNGGDVVFHGKQQDGNETPLSGNVSNGGDGSGLSGDFAGE